MIPIVDSMKMKRAELSSNGMFNLRITTLTSASRTGVQAVLIEGYGTQ